MSQPNAFGVFLTIFLCSRQVDNLSAENQKTEGWGLRIEEQNLELRIEDWGAWGAELRTEVQLNSKFVRVQSVAVSCIAYQMQCLS